MSNKVYDQKLCVFNHSLLLEDRIRFIFPVVFEAQVLDNKHRNGQTSLEQDFEIK